MIPNSITAVRTALDDGVLYDCYPTLLNNENRIVHIWPAPILTLENMNDIPVICERLKEAQARGAIDAGELIAVGWWHDQQ